MQSAFSETHSGGGGGGGRGGNEVMIELGFKNIEQS